MKGKNAHTKNNYHQTSTGPEISQQKKSNNRTS